ncbi:MAG: cadherin domain-containing protein [Bacteroidota bacterium]
MKSQSIKLLVLATLVMFSGCGDDESATLNLPPEIANQSFNASEAIDDQTVIGIVQATDPEGEALTFSISTNSGDLFEITSTGAISLAEGQSLDFETATSHALTVVASNQTESATATVTINVVDENENMAPVVAAQTFTAAESATDTDVIGIVLATDPDEDALTFSIVEDEDDLFAITTDGFISLQAGKSLDFESKTSHALTVQANDGQLNTSAIITIDVTDVNELPQINEQSFTANESTQPGVIFGTVVGSDPEGDQLSFTITEDPDDLFRITSDGELSVDFDRKLDFETKTSHSITVQVADEEGFTSATISIVVENQEFDEDWFSVGTNGTDIAPGPTNGNIDMDIAEDGTPYVAYREMNNEDKLSVRRFDGNTWVLVGNQGISNEGIFGMPNITIHNNIPYVLYNSFNNAAPETNGLKVVRFNGTAWESVGNGVVTTNLNTSALKITFDDNDNPYVGYVFTPNGFDRNIEVKQLDSNGDWIDFGTNPIISNSNRLHFFEFRSADQTITAVGASLQVATNRIDDGNDWTLTTTSGINGIGESAVDMDDNGDLFAISRFAVSDGIAFYKLIGATWTSQTNAVAPHRGTLTMDLTIENNVPFVAATAFQSSAQVNVYKVENGNWVTIGNPNFRTNVGQPTLRFDNTGTPYVLFTNPVNIAVYSNTR